VSDFLLLETGDHLLLETGDNLLLESGSVVAGTVVQVGFGSTWQSELSEIAWETVTGYVLNAPKVVTQRGASSARGQVDVGTYKLSLLNSDRRFDPTNTTGPYYGMLLPGTPVRVKHRPEGQAEFAIGYGTIATWPQRFDIGNHMGWVPVDGFDGFDKLARAKIPRSVLESVVLADSPLGYWRLTEGSGDTLGDVGSYKENGEYRAGRSPTVEFLTGEQAAVFDGSVQYAHIPFSQRLGTSWAVECWFRTEAATSGVMIRVASQDLEVQWDGTQIIAGNGTDPSFLASGTGLGDNQWHHLVYESGSSFPSRLVHLWIDGVDVGVTGITNPHLVSDGVLIGGFPSYDSYFDGALAHVAVYRNMTAAMVAAHYEAGVAPLDGQTTDERITWVLDEIGWPATLRDFETGRSLLGAATFHPGDSALAYLRLVAASEDGLLFITADGKLRFLDRYWRYLDTLATVSQFTFSDQTDKSYAEFDLDLDDELLVNVARFTRRGGVEQVATNTASVAAYGEAEKKQSDLLLQTDVEVLSLAEWTVSTRGTPLPRVPKIRVPLHRYSTADQAAVLALELGYRVTVSRTPQGVGSAITQDFVIDGVNNEIGITEHWWTAFVSPVPEDTVPLFIWDTSLWDSVDVLAY
jgi:hypothetical protein